MRIHNLGVYAFLPPALPIRHLNNTSAVPRIRTVVVSDKFDTSALPSSTRPQRGCRTMPESNASNCWGPCAIHLERFQVPAAAYLTSCHPSTGQQRWWSRWTPLARRECSKLPLLPSHCYSWSIDEPVAGFWVEVVEDVVRSREMRLIRSNAYYPRRWCEVAQNKWVRGDERRKTVRYFLRISVEALEFMCKSFCKRICWLLVMVWSLFTGP